MHLISSAPGWEKNCQREVQMTPKTKIVDLMTVPATAHDLDWLKQSLQAAIELEFATIPPYLCAYWSVKDSLNPSAASIHIIWREEMLHMALACNLLTALGGIPALNDPQLLPVYPGELPGGVHPGLVVSLQALSKDAAKTFMDIELPEGGPIAFAVTGTFDTIGAFYQAVQDAFDALQPVLSEDRQLKGRLGLTKISNLDQVRQAIALIQHQGEGSKDSPEDTGPGDLAHYYRFGEIFHERALQKDAVTGEWRFDGAPIPLPDAWRLWHRSHWEGTNKEMCFLRYGNCWNNLIAHSLPC
jgi:Ferritin-like